MPSGATWPVLGVGVVHPSSNEAISCSGAKNFTSDVFYFAILSSDAWCALIAPGPAPASPSGACPLPTDLSPWQERSRYDRPCYV